MRTKILLYLGLLATTAIWGSSFLVMKDSLERQDVNSFLASRFVLAALIMFAFKPKSFSGLNSVFIKRAVLTGVLATGGFISQTFGLTLTTVSNTGFITGLYLVFTPLIAWLLLKHRITRAQWSAVLVATIGLYLIAYNGISVGIGEILVLISAILFAAHKKVDNLIAAIDWNGQQIDGPTSMVMDLGDLASKFESFGWTVLTIEKGNDMDEIVAGLRQAKTNVGKGKTLVILMKNETKSNFNFIVILKIFQIKQKTLSTRKRFLFWPY